MKKLCIAGRLNIAIAVCDYVLEHFSDVEVCAVLTRNDVGIDRAQRSFKKYLTKHSEVHVVRLEDTYEMKDLVFLSLEFDRIIKPHLFQTMQLYNIHFSPLPAYKGMYTAALPILHGRKMHGVTLHRIDAGIDTGEIIAQKTYLLAENETSESMYAKNMQLGTELVIENIEGLLNNTCKSSPQPIEGSTYYSKKAIDYGNLTIDLVQTASQVDARIRAFHFRPYQLPCVNGEPIVYTKITNNRSDAKPGTILENTNEYILVATIDYDIELWKDRLPMMIEAAKNNDVNAIKTVRDLTYYINEREASHGWTMLMVASYNNAQDMVAYLLENGADVNARNYNGTTPLMYAKDGAIKTGDCSVIDVLLKHGADINAVDNEGLSVIDYVKNQSKTIYEYLVNKR